MLGKVKVCVESSKSRSGLHKRRVLYLVSSQNCSFKKVEILKKVKARPIYADGTAECHYVLMPKESYLVLLDFRMNPRSIIKGDIRVMDEEGALMGRAVYRKLKVRVVRAVSSKVLDLIKCAFRKLKLPVKRYGILQGAVES